jgi:hypothetical protein
MEENPGVSRFYSHLHGKPPAMIAVVVNVRQIVVLKAEQNTSVSIYWHRKKPARSPHSSLNLDIGKLMLITLAAILRLNKKHLSFFTARRLLLYAHGLKILLKYFVFKFSITP